MGNRKPNRYIALFSSGTLVMAVIALLISIPFWSGLWNIAGITTKESAKEVVTTIRSWKESYHSEGRHRDLLMICGDGNMYELRWMLYEKRAEEIKSLLAPGAEATIYTGFYVKRIMEISVNGQVVVPFDTGYRALYQDSIGYGAIAAFLDLFGIGMMITEIRKYKHGS